MYNYCYIPNFGDRYYWITDWTYEAGIWVAQLRIDVLATWRETIGNSTQYVLRSSNTFDGSIPDGYYSTKVATTLNTTSGASPWGGSFFQGGFVVGIINSDTYGVGAVSYYVLTWSEFKALCSYLLDSSSWLGVTDISDNLTKSLFNPLQYITSCTWIPVDPPLVDDGGVSSLKFGWWELTGVHAWRLHENPVRLGQVELPLTKHPQAAARGKYLNTSPYTRLSLAFNPFGMFPVDPAAFVDAEKLYALWRVDCMTGEGFLAISPTANYSDVVYQTRAMVGVPIQLA